MGRLARKNNIASIIIVLGQALTLHITLSWCALPWLRSGVRRTERVRPHDQSGWGLLVLGVVATSDGQEMPPHFFNFELKATVVIFLKSLQELVGPGIKSTYTESNYCGQQDSIPGRTSKKVKHWLTRNFAQFWTKIFWPASIDRSVDLWLNLAKFSDVSRVSHHDLADLKIDITHYGVTCPWNSQRPPAKLLHLTYMMLWLPG